MSQRRNSHLNDAPPVGQTKLPIDAKQRLRTDDHEGKLAACFTGMGDEPLELGDYFWFAFPRFYFGLSEAERAPFARYAGAMLERFLQRAQNKEDLRHVALALHRLHFS